MPLKMNKRSSRARRALTLTFLAALVGCGMRPALAEGEPLRPGPYDPLIAKFVEYTLKKQHYSTPRIDDRVSERWLERYVNSLDPMRWYFLASDVEEFREKYGLILDDDLAGDPQLEAAFVVFSRYQQRVQERLDDARELADQEHDFTVAETYRFKRNEAPWPETAEEAADLWRRYIKHELIAGRLQGESDDNTLTKLRKRWDRFEKELMAWEVPDIRERYLNALTTTFDPHSNYLRPATAEDFSIDLTNQLEGIGAVLTSEDGYTLVKEVVIGGPADRSGKLHADDRIVAVAQGDDEPIDIMEMRLDKVVKLIRGPKGSEVRLTVIPAGSDPSDRREIAITRDKVELKDRIASSEVYEIEHEGRAFKLGVITLPTFYTPTRRGGPDASEDVTAELEKLKAEGVDGVVLDLRYNGGGSLTEAVEIGGLFVKSGPMVQVHSPLFPTEVLEDPDKRVVYDGPLLVLTSPISASASEIVAGAIQDYGRGLVVGSKTTHGKGTVQTLVELDRFLEQRVGRKLREPVAGDLKLTTQKFYRISGASTQFKGVESDIVIPSPWDGLDIYESDLENPLPWDEIGATRYKPVGKVAHLVPELARRSEARIQADPEFAKLLDRLAYRAERKGREEVSLVLAEREAEHAAFKARFGEDEAQEEESVSMDDKDKGPDLMRDEALRILADFILLRTA